MTRLKGIAGGTQGDPGRPGARGPREGDRGKQRSPPGTPRFPRVSPASPPRLLSPSVSLGLLRSPRNRQDDDSGALLLLAGFILGVALIVTGLTLSEVAQLENEAVREQDTTFIAEFRSVRDKMGTALYDSVTSTTDVTSFKETFGNVADSFRSLETTRGFGFVSVLAAGDPTTSCTDAESPAGQSECSTLATQTGVPPATCPSTRKIAADGIQFSDGHDGVDDGLQPDYLPAVLEGQCYDGTNDGILVVGTTIKAAYVYIHLDDPTLELEEVVLFKLN